MSMHVKTLVVNAEKQNDTIELDSQYHFQVAFNYFCDIVTTVP